MALNANHTSDKSTAPKNGVLPSLNRKQFDEVKDKPLCIYYTDGSCEAKLKCGGWGASRYLDYNGKLIKVKEQARNFDESTISLMELEAVMWAMHDAPKNRPVLIYTDSEYVQKSICEYLPNWIAKGGRKSNNKPVEHIGHWIHIISYLNAKHIKVEWCKGHSGIEGNERADFLAGEQRAIALIRNGHSSKVNKKYLYLLEK